MSLAERLMRNLRLRYIAMNLIWLWLAVAAIAHGLGMIFAPATVTNGEVLAALFPWTFLWTGLFVAGGLLLIVGIGWMKPDVEALGHALFAGAFTIYTLALISVGLIGLGTFTIPALILASLSRVFLLTTAARFIAEAKDEGEKAPRSAAIMSVAILPALAVMAAGEAISMSILVPIIAVVFGGGGIAAYRMIRPQTNELTARTADAITSAADRIITRQQEEITSLRNEVAQLREAVLHQQTTDIALVTCQAKLESSTQAVTRLDKRVNDLIEVLQNAGLRIPPNVIQDPAAPGE